MWCTTPLFVYTGRHSVFSESNRNWKLKWIDLFSGWRWRGKHHQIEERFQLLNDQPGGFFTLWSSVLTKPPLLLWRSPSSQPPWLNPFLWTDSLSVFLWLSLLHPFLSTSTRFPHSLMLGPSGMHPTGIPHPAIVPPTGKQEHEQYDRGMYM